jgi:poly-gamma-glutamate synthesis protein (capsule biosynthesis protein)
MVNLAFMGDIMPGRGVSVSDSSLDYLEPDIHSADLALANLESPLTDAPASSEGGYSLCAAPESAAILANAGLDLVSVINNHSFDCGLQGFQDTLSNLDAVGLIPLEPDGYTTTIHNTKLTFFAFEDVTSPLDLENATRLIQAASSDGALVIVSMHWGAEYQAGASERQRWLAGQLADAGAVLIWGHHPHVLQPVEWIPAECGSADNRSGCSLVMYSLGNALFDQGGLADTRRSTLVSVTLGQDGIRSVQAMPFLIDPVHSQVIAPDEAEAKLILSRLHLP